MKNVKLGLALGSGGIRGLIHIGVLKALEKHNIPISYIAGSSIGALISAHYALHQDTVALEKLALGKHKDTLLSFLEPSVRGGLIKGEKMKKLVTSWLGEKNFSDCKIPLNIVASELSTGEQVIYDKGAITPAIAASIAIPAVFRPIEYQGKILVDGCITNPVPVDIVKNMGADKVIAVNLDKTYVDKSIKNNNLFLSKVTYRSFVIMRHYLSIHCIKNADYILSPEFKYGLDIWSKFFTQNIGQELINQGEKEAEKIIKQIKN